MNAKTRKKLRNRSTGWRGTVGLVGRGRRSSMPDSWTARSAVNPSSRARLGTWDMTTDTRASTPAPSTPTATAPHQHLPAMVTVALADRTAIHRVRVLGHGLGGACWHPSAPCPSGGIGAAAGRRGTISHSAPISLRESAPSQSSRVSGVTPPWRVCCPGFVPEEPGRRGRFGPGSSRTDSRRTHHRSNRRGST